ncbi:Kinesin-like protein KIF11 [Strongyloides ratti]|uniref:Kinesin-like protein n=1 Tax=Strongyloides ratti TaxID=34506 RepID=A0A090LKM8_STRRB|nr:Kinesin-like protein KIF11 [Strongyloides ratti]CEF70253.1 Kinesin-like protein KIF11 [Strongyloides ratti]
MSSLFATSTVSYGKGGKSCIKVGIRIRPRSSKEIEKNDPSVLRNVGSSIMLADGEKEKKFSGYDFVLDESVTQCQLYKKMVAEYIPQLLSGYNCTIFAYGQTGTGKTFTMEGKCDNLDEDGTFKWDSNNSAGVTSRAMQHIFTMLNIPTCTRKSITITYVELYNEEVYDLLGDDISKKLKIFDDAQNSGSVCIKDVKEYVVNNMRDVYKLLKHGASMRQTAATAMNQRSSRSHAVFTAIVDWDETLGQEVTTRRGKINLVDLAGSENIGKSGATKGSAREAGNINTSLLALGQVINALTERSSHIPYRSSKLTRILKDSLGGSALTCLIAAISPTMSNKGETISTLEYGLKAMNVENDIRANIKARRDQLFSTFSIMNDYIRRINGYFRDAALTTNRSKLLSLMDKDLFSKIDSLILKKDDLFEEAHIWFTTNTEALNNFEEEMNEQAKILNDREFAVMALKFKMELLEDEIQEELNNIEKLSEKSKEMLVNSQNCHDTLSSKILFLEEKCCRGQELFKKQKNFFNQYAQEIQHKLNECEELEKVTISNIDNKLKELRAGLTTEIDSIAEIKNIETKENIESANKLLDSVTNVKDSIVKVLNSQDIILESFKTNKDKFEASVDGKFQELKAIQNYTTEIQFACEGKLKENIAINEEINLIDKYSQEIKSLIKSPEKSKAAIELEKYLSEIENF